MISDMAHRSRKAGIAWRSRIGAHEDLDRFFGIIEESFEILGYSRLARGWNLNFF